VKKACDAIIEFGAKALVISIGYDIIDGDPHGKWHSLKPSIFEKLGKTFVDLGIPLCFIQEGGYSINQLGDCAYQLATGLLK